MAQLGERRVRNAEVEGSIPFGSTTTNKSEPCAGWRWVRIYCFYLSIRVECETSLMQFSISGIIKSIMTVDNRMVVSYNELCKPQEGKSYANT